MQLTHILPPLLLAGCITLSGCQTAPPAPPPLTFEDVVLLAASEHTSVDVLRIAVYNAGLDFALDPAALRRLRERGLTLEQIEAVLEGAVALETDAGVPVRSRPPDPDGGK